MKINLYHYVHCPYCIRVRMVLGFLSKTYESRVLSYDDEKTPVVLAGKKMLPIVTVNDGLNDFVSNESLIISEKLDQENILFENVSSEDLGLVNELLSKIGKKLHPLAMPLWINTPEFDDLSRSYFINKKEATKGPFSELIKNSDFLKIELSELLDEINYPDTFYKGDRLSILDIMISSHLYGLYVLTDFYIPRDCHEYLQRVRHACRFNYHEDFLGDKKFDHWKG